jgi:sulfate adenylyltransferase large subunit
MAMKEEFKFVVVGHVDHGKSTLIGRLLFDTDSLPPDKVEEIRAASDSTGTPEFAFVMDHLEEERENLITIDTAQVWFKTEKRDYVIIDAPGHKQFLKNMITGSSQASAALLLIDAKEGIREQTQRHAYLLSLLGIKQLIVVINKMDLVDFKEDRFNELKVGIIEKLSEYGLTALHVVPISAKEGDNLAKKTDTMPWFKGRTLLACLDDLKAGDTDVDGVTRFPVQDIYDHDDEKVIVGKLISGSLGVGQEVIFHPCGKSATIKEIVRFESPKTGAAVAGECIGIKLEDGIAIKAIKRGEIACDVEPSPMIGTRLVAPVFWMSGEPIEVGDTIEFKCATQQIECQVKKISDRINSSTLEMIESQAKELCDTEVAKLTLQATDYAVTDTFEQVQETGRFVLVRDGDTVAGGIFQ